MSRVKSHPVPKVGDTVHLNDYGLEQLFNSRLGLQHMKLLDLIVTKVDSESLTEPELTFQIEVDHPEINEFLIDNWCVDIVRGNVSLHEPQDTMAAPPLPASAKKVAHYWFSNGKQIAIHADDDAFFIRDEHGNYPVCPIRRVPFEHPDEGGPRCLSYEAAGLYYRYPLSGWSDAD